MSEDNGRPPEKRDNAGVVAPPPAIFFVPLLASILANRALGIRISRGNPLRAFGVLGIISGFALVSWTGATMRRADASVNPYTPTENLAVSGPFRLTRNPIYLSMTLIYTGVSLLANSLPSLLILPAIIRVMNRGVIEREEAYLRRKFGSGYDDYAKSVRRWL